MQATMIQHCVKGVYALAIAWVVVAAIGAKPWGTPQQVAPTQPPQSYAETLPPAPSPTPIVEPSPVVEPIDPSVQYYVGWVRTWDLNQTATWVAWCLQNGDGINSANPEDRQICQALKLK